VRYIEPPQAGFVFEVPGIPVAKQSTRFTTKGKRPHAYPDKNVEDWQTTVGQYAMVARTDHSWAMTRKPVAVKLIFRLPDRRKRDIDNLEKCVLDGLKGVLFEDDDQVVQVTKRKVINKDHPGVTIIVELDNPVEDCE
jgi:Holliday junction resolvase RusA-like endonuclease